MKRLFVLAAILTLLSQPLFAASTEGKDLLPLGSSAPDFTLKDVSSGNAVSISELPQDKPLVVMFICRHCPYVQRVLSGLAEFGKDYKDRASVVSISANDAEGYPEDSPEKLKEMAAENGFVFPLLLDETQEVAKNYTAVATPDIFVFDNGRKLVYRGQFDDARPGNQEPVTGKDVRAAVDALLAGQPVSADQKPAVGCSIKWKKGNAPAYA